MSKTQYPQVLNALVEMQNSLLYAARRSVLQSAESIIVNLEHLLQQSLETIGKLNGEVATLKLEKSQDCRVEAKLFLEAMDAFNALEKTIGWAGMGGHVGSPSERFRTAERMHKARRALEVKLNNPDGPLPPPKKD